MSRAQQLPFLPGYSFNLEPKQNHHKAQKFAVQNGVRLVDVNYAQDKACLQQTLSMADSLKQTMVVEPVLDPKDKRAVSGVLSEKSDFGASSSGPFTSVEAQPNWLAMDRKVLRFFGFFQEVIHSSPIENFRVRKVVLYYYLEDESMHIAEPRADNSGIPQGVLVKRHRIPHPDKPNQFLTPKELAIGADVSIYGRSFHIVDADPFTRSFVKAKFDLELGDSEDYPLDPHTEAQNTKNRSNFNKLMSPQKTFMEATLGRAMGIRIDATQKFLQNDRKVLRFYCLWQDPAPFGEKRPYVLHYFLADDTVEVKEIAQANSGRDPYPALLRRSKLPKNYAKTVANVATIGVQPHEDSKQDYYSDADLHIGSKINVFGRDILLWGCDKFTQSHYIKNRGFSVEDFPVVDVSEPEREFPKMETPPYNGYGTEEDSLGSFTHLVPKPPRKDLKKLMANDQNNLRFSAKFANPGPHDNQRSFIITWYMADDTISVFEKPERNSGFVGGKFLERSRTKECRTGKYLEASDFYVGASMVINNYAFTLSAADEYSLKFMESNPAIYTHSDIFAIYSEVSTKFNVDELAADFRAADVNGSGQLSRQQIQAVFDKHATAQGVSGFSEQQSLTLFRALAGQNKNADSFSWEQLIANVTHL